MERRKLLTAGLACGAAALSLAEGREAGAAVPGGAVLGVSVTDYGVEPDGGGDQTAAIQKAIDESAARGRPVLFPPGSYRAARLTLPAAAALIGAAGRSELALAGSGPLLEAPAAQRIHLSGLRLAGAGRGAGQKSGDALALVKGGAVVVDRCEIGDCAGPALVIEAASALDVSHCRFAGCPEGLRASAAGTGGSPASITHNRAVGCGLRIEGDALVTANIITGAARVGLHLGAAQASGRIMAAHNMIGGAPIGVGVAAEGDGYYMLSLNLITDAREGAIRALDRGKPVGPDLARASAEAFRHLGLFGNVAQ